LLVFWVSHDNTFNNPQVSELPPPNRTCDVYRIRLSLCRSGSVFRLKRPSSLWLLDRFVLQRSVLRVLPTFMDTFLHVSIGYSARTPDRLVPFALWTAFPPSDYYGTSDAPRGHWPTAGLGIPHGASHVHASGLCEEV